MRSKGRASGGRKFFWKPSFGPAFTSSRTRWKKRFSALAQTTLTFCFFTSLQEITWQGTALWKKPAIGLSNFTAEQIREILAACQVKPAVLQTEVHPYSQEKELKKFLQKEGMVVQAWYPLGHGDKALLQEPLFAELGEKYGKSSAQIILRWHIQDGNIVIPGSKNPAHIKDNFDLFDFSLNPEEMARISAMDRKSGTTPARRSF